MVVMITFSFALFWGWFMVGVLFVVLLGGWFGWAVVVICCLFWVWDFVSWFARVWLCAFGVSVSGVC